MNTNTNPLQLGQIVFFSRTEDFWDKPFVMKRHHIPDTRSVILRGLVTDIRGEEFKAKLHDNNNFEKDGQEFVFNKGCLLSNQNYTDMANLGQWSIQRNE